MNKNSFSGFKTQTIPEATLRSFDELDANTQKTLYHLSMAGAVCRDVAYIQNSKYSLAVKEVLEDIYLNIDMPKDIKLNLEEDLKLVWLSNGIYTAGSGKRMVPKTAAFIFQDLLNNPGIKTSKQTQKLAYIGLYEPNIPDSINSGDPSIPSGFNTHDTSISSREKYIKFSHNLSSLFFKDKAPPVGLNMYLSKNEDGDIQVNFFSSKGMFGEYLSRAVHHLEQALNFSGKNPSFKKSVESLIEFLNNGSPLLFDKHSIDWVNDQQTKIFFVFGFIETYSDPLKEMGSFQSLVGFEDTIGTKMINVIIDNAQYLEDNLPFDKSFKREVATGSKGAAANLLSFSGDGGPVVSLGNCLPNNWIREKIGSRSTIFSNIIKERAIPKREVFERFLNKEYHDHAELYLETAINYWIQLHECVGHASGKLNDGVAENALGTLGSVIEECRADLVAMYYVGDVEFTTQFLSKIAPQITNVDMFIKVAYAQYLTDGVLFQLSRVDKGEHKLAQAHFRNRQINSSYVIEKALELGGLHWSDGDHGRTLVIDNVQVVRECFSELLVKVQTITSTGNVDESISLIDKYGTFIIPSMKNDAHKRVSDLGLPKYVGFHSPVFKETGDKNSPYKLFNHDDFVSDQLHLTEISKT